MLNGCDMFSHDASGLLVCLYWIMVVSLFVEKKHVFMKVLDPMNWEA